jgi:hypothetical protein
MKDTEILRLINFLIPCSSLVNSSETLYTKSDFVKVTFSNSQKRRLFMSPVEFTLDDWKMYG